MQSLTRTLSATVIAVSALAAGGVHAQTTSGNYSLYSPGASYIGLNVGKSDFKLNNGGLGNFSAEDRDTSYNIYAGSYFNNNFGLELGYTDFGRVDRNGGTTKAEGINLSLIGRWPLTNSFNLLGKLGTTYGRTNVSANPLSGVATGRETGFGASYGIGAEYAFTPAWSAVLQYDEHRLKYAGGDKERIGNTSVGVRYRF